MNDNRKNLKQSSESQEIHIARLTFIGASISTLGDGLQAVAAGLALEALEKKQGSRSSNEQSKQIEDIEKQIDYLINELKKIKRIMK
ncbi:translation initiation factor 2 [Solibacillus sp. CAU 1738]|uniref:translation initiation factor 2 n=1 Tax=Solibacillus sp. CAU 1738 TaxID=3140363 RepID=UPI003261AF9F